ncbi:MAG: hypothetical protein IPM54_41305 [Polyangiaceae bacterium]|nr:hypothetical protein [Polyangiaceae bacterium]
MFGKSHGVAITGFLVTVAIYGTTFVTNGCGLNTGGEQIHCGTDADPEIWPICYEDAGTGIEPLACTGQCVEMGTADFRERPVLLWMGAEEEQPKCPERANSEFYTGYADLNVALPCQKCECGPAKCVMPSGMVASSNNACQGSATAYDGPTEWDGSCVSPAKLPAGSFHSIGLTPASVSSCEPIGNAEPKAPSFAPEISSFAGGVYWKNYVKACQGTAQGFCPSSGDLCIPSTEPPPPEFRYCVQYALPVDESNLPQCPKAFPERFTFYAGTKGKVECSPCQCGEPVGAQCSISFSAYQDATCSGAPMPLFQNVPAFDGSCIDFGAASVALASMEAKWTVNKPGTCEVSGGELIGEVKPVDPRVFCCQAPAPSAPPPTE